MYAKSSGKVVKVREYATSISCNSFIGNEVGQKGSAIYARQISFLEIADNQFIRNVPSYAFRKDVYRPYDLAFLDQKGISVTNPWINSTIFQLEPDVFDYTAFDECVNDPNPAECKIKEI